MAVPGNWGEAYATLPSVTAECAKCKAEGYTNYCKACERIENTKAKCFAEFKEYTWFRTECTFAAGYTKALDVQVSGHGGSAGETQWNGLDRHILQSKGLVLLINGQRSRVAQGSIKAGDAVTLETLTTDRITALDVYVARSSVGNNQLKAALQLKPVARKEHATERNTTYHSATFTLTATDDMLQMDAHLVAAATMTYEEMVDPTVVDRATDGTVKWPTSAEPCSLAEADIASDSHVGTTCNTYQSVPVKRIGVYTAEQFLLTNKAHTASTDPNGGAAAVCDLTGHCAKLTATPTFGGDPIPAEATANGVTTLPAGSAITLLLDGGVAGAGGMVRLTGKDYRVRNAKCRRGLDRAMADELLTVSGISGQYAQPYKFDHETYTGKRYGLIPFFHYKSEQTPAIFTQAKLDYRIRDSIDDAWGDRRARRAAGTAAGGVPMPRAKRCEGSDCSEGGGKAPEPEACEPDVYPPQLRTWLVDTVTLDGNGKARVEVEVPDEANTWEITGVLLTKADGIAESSPLVIEADKPFFIAGDMPYTVAKGEVFQATVAVTHIHAEGKKARVEVQAPPGVFQALADVEGGASASCSLDDDGHGSVSFYLTPIKVGVVTVTVYATYGDEVQMYSQRIRIIPPGVLKEYTLGATLEMPQGTPTDLATFQANAPTVGFVEDSKSIRVCVTGSLMVATLNNIGRLIKKPSGCGEQNMINFAPIISAITYLKKANLLTAAIQADKDFYTKARAFMIDGYNRELTYQHTKDLGGGGFSAFGDRDGEGSLWLTAFVLRTYAITKKSGDIFRVGSFLDFVWLTTRTSHGGVRAESQTKSN